MTDHDKPAAAAAVRGLDPVISLAMCVQAGPGVYALLLGAGMSRDAGVPTGWEIVTDLVRRAAIARGADVRLAVTDPEAWWARHGDGGPLGYSALLEALGGTPAARHKLLRGYFEPDDEDRQEGLKRPGVAHHAVAQLVARGWVRVVLTTNFDRLTEQALEAAGVQPQVIHSPNSLPGMTPLAHARATVVKLHGDLTDLEARNTERELEEYPAAWAGLVDQVLDEYGLIVCGWSAQWDRALVACLERRATRRYPVFWAVPHGPRGKAAELVARNEAVVIQGLTAREFFPGLLTRVEALEHLAAPAPTRELSVARLKRALPDPVRRIELHELVDAEAMRVVERLADGRRYPPVERAAGPEAYRERLERYQSDCDTLLHLMAVGAFHDEAGTHARVWVRALQRLLNVRGDGGGEPGAALHLYPALLALSAAGSAAVLAGRDDLLGRLLLEPVLAHPSATHPGSRRTSTDPKPAVLALRTGEVLGAGELLNALLDEPYPPPLAQTSHSTWLRERLREALAEPAAGSDRAISDAFDHYEYLTVLLQVDLSEPPMTLGEFTLPDRWDGEGRLRVAARVQARFSESWPMLRSGAFDGEIQRAHTAAAVVDVLCVQSYMEVVGREPFR
ncbi:SIR2 family protein [Streptomyces sp. TRM76323]|uniref:SIR2 family protein n=1 Tax=Streptomyces tamarix TaxID=3078565 RepID=A0ABU3QL32_9ACTN|nr:SIR2 family protein [Streptomyces tamarix]MDT9683485.1 SIR2 family protein [Streptomyces tamarix]